MVSQKCQYALRAAFELAKRYGQGPARIADIAKAQAIPVRFLEVILSEMRRGGFVESRRGAAGGYMLASRPQHLTVGDIIGFIEGSPGPFACGDSLPGRPGCPVHEHCVFMPLWERAHAAVSEVYDETTFQGMVNAEARMHADYVHNYAI